MTTKEVPDIVAYVQSISQPSWGLPGPPDDELAKHFVEPSLTQEETVILDERLASLKEGKLFMAGRCVIDYGTFEYSDTLNINSFYYKPWYLSLNVPFDKRRKENQTSGVEEVFPVPFGGVLLLLKSSGTYHKDYNLVTYKFTFVFKNKVGYLVLNAKEIISQRLIVPFDQWDSYAKILTTRQNQARRW